MYIYYTMLYLLKIIYRSYDISAKHRPRKFYVQSSLVDLSIHPTEVNICFPTLVRLDGARAKIFIAGIIGGAKPMAGMEMDGMATLASRWVSNPILKLGVPVPSWKLTKIIIYHSLVGAGGCRKLPAHLQLNSNSFEALGLWKLEEFLNDMVSRTQLDSMGFV